MVNRQTALFAGLLVIACTMIASREEAETTYVVDDAGGKNPVNKEDFPARLGPGPVYFDLKADTRSAHSASLVRLANGDLVAFWFAGSREGARDVRIYSARLRDGRWSPPTPILSPTDVALADGRWVRKLGNPVAVADAAGRLHLFVVSVSLGGWATSQLNQVTSRDGGVTWGPSRRLTTSPFLNLSTLAKAAALPRDDGGFDLPAYHEGARKFPELLRFNGRGRLVRKIRMTGLGAYLQPALGAQDAQRAFALLRDASANRKLRALRTADAGDTWSAPSDTNLTNPDSAVAVARLSDGTFVLAYNPRTDGRSELALATSRDGVFWDKKRVVENETGGEFSYPFLVAAGDAIHLVYTWQRKHIRYFGFRRDWLDGEPEKPGAPGPFR